MKESAGLVIIYNNTILLAHPTGQGWYGTYSIPKGHVEEGEDYLTAALRETYEELGISFNKAEINPNSEGYINYIDENGNLYKRVYFYIIELKEPLKVYKSQLQNEEIDWAGFLTKKEAEKRIFWRFKTLLSFLK